jgi:hypothetical protein
MCKIHTFIFLYTTVKRHGLPHYTSVIMDLLLIEDRVRGSWSGKYPDLKATTSTVRVSLFPSLYKEGGRQNTPLSAILLVPEGNTHPDPGERERETEQLPLQLQPGRMRSGGGGEREDEEAAHKLKSMDVNKLQKGGSSSDEDSPHPPRPAVKYHGWRAMPFIIGTPRELPGSDLSCVFMAGVLSDWWLGGLQGTRRSRSLGPWARRRTCWCT